MLEQEFVQIRADRDDMRDYMTVLPFPASKVQLSEDGMDVGVFPVNLQASHGLQLHSLWRIPNAAVG